MGHWEWRRHGRDSPAPQTRPSRSSGIWRRTRARLHLRGRTRPGGRQYPRTFATPSLAARNETWPGLRRWSLVSVERGAGLPHIPARKPVGRAKTGSGRRRLLALAKSKARADLPPTTRPTAARRAPNQNIGVSYSIGLASRCPDPSPNRDQLPPRPEEQRAIRHRRRCEAGLVQLIGTCERVLAGRRHHKNDALFAREIQLLRRDAAEGPGRPLWRQGHHQRGRRGGLTHARLAARHPPPRGWRRRVE